MSSSRPSGKPWRAGSEKRVSTRSVRFRVLLTLLAGGLALVLLLLAAGVVIRFYTDLLWFEEVDYLAVFWTRFWMGVGVRGAAAVVAAAVLLLNLWIVLRHLRPVRVRRRYGNLEIAEQIPPRVITVLTVAVAVLGGWWLAGLHFRQDQVLGVLAWARQVPWGVADPLHGRDVAFYVHTLPFLRSVLGFAALVVVWSTVLVALAHVLGGGVRLEEGRPVVTRPALVHLATLSALLVGFLGIHYWLGTYGLVVGGTGVGGSLGYTDVQARMPVYRILAVVAVAAGGTLVLGSLRGSFRPPVIGLGALLLVRIGLAGVYPVVVQRFGVEPNELAREATYIRWHIDFTRAGWGVEELRRVPFAYRREASLDATRIEPLRARLPLWDTEPMLRAFNETQSLREYYGFPDADFDRYGPPGEERQVVVGVREFRPEGLEPGSRTWQSLHLNPLYIRGRGAVVSPASPTVEGRGTHELWLRNIDPIERSAASPPELGLTQWSVFYGETMGGYVVVIPGRDGEFTGEAGLDHPRGIPLRSFGRVLAFAWRFGDETLLFAREITEDSRLIFRRPVRERVQAIAPFVHWDGDALPVVHEGRVIWLLDGYTASDSYPLSRPLAIGRVRVRYLRNSVKAAVDAVTGTVTFYRIDPRDPLLATYDRVFPGLFRPLDTMPEGLRRHLRYPELKFMAQAEILQEFHLNRVEAFYAGEDLWQRPQQAAPGGGIRSFRPARGFMPVPPAAEPEYVLALPFIARGRQNMTALLVAGNDESVYGALTLVEFPRDQQVPGPGQVQAMIEQDPVIAPELSLLRQRGSQIDMGKLRVLPLDSTVLYVQPFFLSADENPIPEIWGIVASDGREVALGTSLDMALAGLGLHGRGRAATEDLSGPGVAGMPGVGVWPRRALDLLERAEARLRVGDWAGYGRALEELRALLHELEPRAERPGT
jgi:uncharacterized protein